MHEDQPLVADPNNIRLAMLGMVDGNGHPFSWSAIINGGYDKDGMLACGYPGICDYLFAQPASALGIEGAKVTHVWCDDAGDAKRVAKAACVEHVLQKPEDAIGQVDAVLIATDIGHEHVERARAFVEAGVPVFVDKPMVDNEKDLQQFHQWVTSGRAIMTSSCMRYAHEFRDMKLRLPAIGPVEAITVTMAKTWERYGIHALEAVYHLVEPGQWLGVSNTGSVDHNIVHARHTSGTDLVLIVAKNLTGAFGHVVAYGQNGRVDARFEDTFHAFKSQLAAYVNYLRTSDQPIAWGQTIEQMKLVIAGIRSRDEAGRYVPLTEVKHVH